jgi:ligand-binding sensor domain-containing protein
MRSALLLLLLLFLPDAARAQSGRNWRPDERVLITAFHEVGALTSDTRAVFVATRGGLLQYDFLRNIWLLPSTQEDGYPLNDAPTALAIDRLQEDVWLGTTNGALYRRRGVQPRWESVAFALGSEVSAIIPSTGVEEDGIWVQTRSGWFRAGRLSSGAFPVPPGRVPAAIVQRAAALHTLDPALAAFRARLGLDVRSRRWPLTSFTRGDRTDQFWLGTNGGFVFRFDALRAQPEWFWYGAPTRGVSAIALAHDRVWFGGDGRGPRNGVARASADLQTWELLEPLDGGPGGRIEQIVATESHVYFAGSEGVTRIERAGTRTERLHEERANTVAVVGEHVWIGTRSGLVHIANGNSRPVLGPAISRLRAVGDRIWLAAANGLYQTAARAHADSTVLQREAGLPVAPFHDVVQAGPRMVAVTADAVFIRDNTSWRGPIRVPVMRGLGRLSALAADGDAVWLGGQNGLARYQPATEEWLIFLAPQDLPAGPTEIAAEGERVWLATPVGALRLDWRRR